MLTILEIARTRIDWKETEREMREAKFSDEEIRKFREKPVERYIRFLDEWKEVPIILKGPHSLISIKSKTEPYKPLLPIISPKRLKKTTTWG